ncbi:MAG: endonuclease/exonuclease/phosphatase family protein [Bacteroidales bacterium]|nr:endonuclease/exonuclease/phosphatase family protein [Bacteroidales bacterium]
MIKKLSVFIFLCIGISSFPRTITDTSETVILKVLSWNIQMLPNGFDIFSESLRKLQHVRVDWIIEHCLAQDYDIIVFQEVFDVQMKHKIRKHLKSEYPFQVNTRTKFGRFTSNGILIVSKLPIKYIDHVIYNRGVHADAWASKGCTLVEGEKDGHKFQLAGTHLQAGGSKKAKFHRRSQYKDIAHLIEKNKKDRTPVLVAGDMNTGNEETEDYKHMLEVLNVLDFPVNDTCPFTIDCNNSWNFNSRSRQLDYILIQAHNTVTQIYNQYVLRLTRDFLGKTTDYSDHYGLVAEIELGN